MGRERGSFEGGGGRSFAGRFYMLGIITINLRIQSGALVDSKSKHYSISLGKLGFTAIINL